MHDDDRIFIFFSYFLLMVLKEITDPVLDQGAKGNLQIWNTT